MMKVVLFIVFSIRGVSEEPRSLSIYHASQIASSTPDDRAESALLPTQDKHSATSICYYQVVQGSEG